MQLTKNFHSDEFKSKDGAETPCEALANLKELALNLEVLRAELGKPIHINSGYRSPEHNKKIGGATKSQHKEGKAGDLKVKRMKPYQVYNIIQRLISEGKMKEGGLGLYNSFVHYDIRGTKARWNFAR